MLCTKATSKPPNLAHRKCSLDEDKFDHVDCLLMQRIQDGDDEYEELTPTMHWLYERRVFHAIFDLPVFVKFR